MDRIRLALAVCFCLCGVMIGSIACATPTIPSPPRNGYVLDEAGLLARATRDAVGRKLEKLATGSSRRLYVIMVPSLGGLDVEDYGTRVTKAWNLGFGGRRGEAVLLVAPHEKRARVEASNDLSTPMSETIWREIVQTRLFPKVRVDDLNGGVSDVTNALIDQVQAPTFEERLTRNVDEQAGADRKLRPFGFFSDIFGQIMLGLVLSALAYLAHRAWRFVRGDRRPVRWAWTPVSVSSSSEGGGRGGAEDGDKTGVEGGGGSFGGGGASGDWR